GADLSVGCWRLSNCEAKIGQPVSKSKNESSVELPVFFPRDKVDDQRDDHHGNGTVNEIAKRHPADFL
ncbi:MAG TPA: hypothetical protein VGC95_13665, partial [Chitinophagaceae bacterium]